jgi:trigger factor
MASLDNIKKKFYLQRQSMEINAQMIDSANATLTAVIKKAQIDVNINKIAKDLSKTASVAGFRKGKVPIAVIKTQYGEKLVEDAESRTLSELLDASLTKLNIKSEQLIGEPKIVEFQKDEGDIKVLINIFIRPSIDLGDYLSLVPVVAKEEASEEEIEEKLKELASDNASYSKIKEDRALKADDMSLIDFKGYIDGKELKGGSGDNYSLQIGSNSFIEGFEEAMIGMKIGEEREINLNFPTDYQNADLAGKGVKFDVKLNEIQVKDKQEINDELAQTIMPKKENANVSDLKNQIIEQIVSQKASKKYQDEYKPSLIEALVKAIDCDLPHSIVEEEIDMAVNKKASTMSEEEINEIKENQDKLEELREELREGAQKSVKATFIIDELATKEGVRVTEQEVTQTLYYEAMMSGQDPEALLKQYKESGYLPAVEMAMIEDKVLSKLLDAKKEV